MRVRVHLVSMNFASYPAKNVWVCCAALLHAYHAWGSTTSPRSSASCTGSKYRSGLTISSPFSSIQVSAGCSAVVPCRRPLPDGRRRGSTSSAFGLVTVSCCVLYAAVDVRRPSFPGCRLASLEQSATSRHVCTVTVCFLQSSEDSSLQSQFSLTILLCLRSDTRYHGHINRCSYLLTYLSCVCDVMS